MGSCAAPSAKGDDKFITTDYLQQCPARWADSHTAAAPGKVGGFPHGSGARQGGRISTRQRRGASGIQENRCFTECPDEA
ncbi:hypothetical protein CDA56_29845 (plasmid) [Klebsiella michiganensis]|nr:hypothetical protein F7Q97_29370 [Klebsiella michiganensis]PPA44694.1 hypothetical protein CDA56_29845 [Klebsiella michiganensis]